MAELTFNVLWEILNYDFGTGKLFWRERPRKYFKTDRHWNAWNVRFANKEAFTALNADNYKNGTIFKTNYKAHRVIWYMCFGYWPNNEIDHIDGDRLNNRIDNLRDVKKSINMKNKAVYSKNKSGISGVSFRKERNKWEVKISNNGKETYLGYYDNFADAILIRKQAELECDYHNNHGRSNLLTT